MRTILIAATMLTAGMAQAQQRVVMHGPGMAGASYPQPMAGAPMPPPPPGPMLPPPHPGSGQHWGGHAHGGWAGGMHAPGGYAAYWHPYRGYRLPSYWYQPSFFVSDWSQYGLAQPPYGYRWSRYYDDAVLVDDRGSVYDAVSDVNWDGYDSGDGYAVSDQGYAPSTDGYAGAGYPPQQEQGYYDQHRSNGVGGALVGGAVGAGAGALIAGRHDKVGGAILGAGVGALAGYGIDRAAHRDRYAPLPPRPGAPYTGPGGYPGADYDGYRSQGGYARQSWGGTTVTTSSVGGVSRGTWVNGAYYPPAQVTTVTIASAPVVTTTTTEVFEDSVTYVRPAVHRVYRKRVYYRRPRCGCR